MSGCVLDASALLALLLDETGAERVRNALDGASMSAVNLAEVVSYFARFGAERAAIAAMLDPLPVRILPVDVELSYVAGLLRAATATAGLSLGDRYCLALARREGATAMTADRQWMSVAGAAGVTVAVIR